MKAAKNTPGLERLLAPPGDCLTPESARRLLALKPDPEVQAHVDELATRHTGGQLTHAEQTEYGRCVAYATFLAILKFKARQVLAASRRAAFNV